MSPGMDQMWSDPKIASKYRGAEQITATFAKCLLVQAGLPSEQASGPETPLIVLDNACGTGMVSESLWETLDERARKDLQLVCGDISEGMVKHVEKKIEEQGSLGAVARVLDATDTGLPDEHFTHVITNFAIMLVPDSDAALNECFRILQPSGICAFSTWDTVGWIPDVRAAFATLPGSPPFPDPETFHASIGKGRWYEASFVAQKLAAVGFVDVKVEVVRQTSQTKDATEFCDIFETMLHHIKEQFWSEEERRRCGPLLPGALLTHLKDKYGDGVIEMHWAAILATGRKPAE
ncbi:hypothetical protein MMC07_007169 [Pseudocyphellaria aurata]|nr:hypothetical protein [Pseudocyphellaria aurata]